jgi:NAD(P)-dependent dehydrogenase (short-subunit alcohol dehydrogenase family)
MQNLAGKTAFVTGGGSGIGLGIAKALLGAGMKVVIADVREDHLEDAREELDGRGDVLPIPLDVTDREAFAAAADETERKFGHIHILVNNAGVAALGPVELAAYGDWTGPSACASAGRSTASSPFCRASSRTVRAGTSSRPRR